MAKPVGEILKKLGIVPHDESLFVMAFTHSSCNAFSNGSARLDYERLEFLGDSLIGFAVGQLCYRLHPEMRQGELSILRSNFIRTEYESKLSLELGFGDYVQVGPSYTADPRLSLPLMEDIFESFVGALYLDQGLEKALDFLEGLYGKAIKEADTYVDSPKSRLQELLQADYKEAVTYRLIREENENNEHLFVMGAYFEDLELGEGKGKTKKEAETNAARAALAKNAFSRKERR